MSTDKAKVAVIGSGISGLHCAYLLDDRFDVTVFEKNDYLGGHTDTHEFDIDGEQVSVDSGFIVFCEQFYPNFSNMVKALDVPTQTTEMSFSAHDLASGLIYNATSLNKLFCQRRNLLNPKFYSMIKSIIRFYRQAPRDLPHLDLDLSVADYLKQANYPSAFFDWHLAPMIGALWSATPQKVSEYPIVHLVDYMSHHGMMNLFNRPEWKTIVGGSNTYIKALRKKLKARFLCNQGVTRVQRTDEHVDVFFDKSNSEQFDYVIFSCHSSQALELIDSPTETEQQVLSAIKFQPNEVVIHTDERVMHSNPLSWASWNTRIPKDSSLEQPCTAVYWMNALQNLDCKKNIFVSLNPQTEIDSDKVLKRRSYQHPIFDQAGVAAQKRLAEINGKNKSYFTGAYWGWGFHEDGARSAFDAAQLLFKTALDN